MKITLSREDVERLRKSQGMVQKAFERAREDVARTMRPAPPRGAPTLPTEPHWVTVVARPIDNPDEPERRRVNYNNPVSRAWLERYQTWCMFNRVAVTIAPEVVE